MFREFNVKFEDVEMLGGADNLLEGTEVTKVIVRGDNNKMSSLDSMLKNCNELDTVDGELDLNGVSDIDNLLEGTELVKNINLKNINNENISANNSFPHIEEINIGGEVYNKKAMQNVIASKDWTFDNITYSGTVGDNVVVKEVNVIDDNKVTIQDTLEQKATGIEIIGQTYENLVVGSGEATLLDELTIESIDGSPKEFSPHIEQPVCVEVIEGETYQNLVDGKGEYKLTDTFSTTWTESNNSIENPPSMIEIPEIWGNTVQDENDLNIIQSVGDLYVDEEGSPILDEEDNEQYKLEIENTNKNLFSKFGRTYPETEVKYSTMSWFTSFDGSTYKLRQEVAGTNLTGQHNILTPTLGNTGRENNPILFKGKTYTISGIFKWKENPKSLEIGFHDSNGGVGQTLGNLYGGVPTGSLEGSFVSYTFTPKVDLHSIYLRLPYGGSFTFDLEISNFMIEENTVATEYVKPQSNKTTILMPCQLSRIKGSSTYDITDKLLFSKDKETYIIEKNINTYTTPTINYTGGLDVNLNLPSDMVGSNNNINNYPFIIEGAKVQGWSMGNLTEFAIKRYGNDKTVRLATSSSFTNEEISTFLSNKNVYYVTNSPQTIETKILEKPSLETYSPKTYISTNTEIQPSKMTITNKKVDFIPLGLQANKDYTLQLDSVGKDDKTITVNLGGTETTVQPTNDTSKHHKVVVRTPNTLTTDKLELSGEGVVVNDVMLFEGGSNEIKQEVEYIEGIQNISELQEDRTYKIDILSHNKNLFDKTQYYDLKTNNEGNLNAFYYKSIQLKPNTQYCIYSKFNEYIDTLKICNSLNRDENVLANSAVSSEKSVQFITDNTGKIYIHIVYYLSEANLKKCLDNALIQIEQGNSFSGYVEHKKTQTSILLPQPLNKIGEIKDKFYWDENKGHYCIEQSMISITPTEDDIVDSLFKLDGYYTFAIKVDNVNAGNLIGINSYGISLVPYASLSGLNKEYISFGNEPSLGQICAIVRIKNSRASNKAELLEYFKSNKFTLVYKLSTPNIIDLPHLNKKYSLDTYMPTTYLECTNSPMQPSRLLLESDTVRYKPSTLETDTDYTIQFECKEKSDKKVKLNLGGTEKEVDAVVGLNHVSITTPSEIDASLYKDRLFLSGVGNKVADVIVAKGEMSQYPNYFDGVQNTGELQDDGTYLIGIKTNEGFNVSIQTNNALAKGDKLYWNKSNKRYEIDRGGSIEVPTVSGDVIDLPRLYQRENTNFSTSTGNIKPSKVKLDYNDLD